MNERGISFVETLLAVSVLFLLTFTLIPFTYEMKATMQKQIASYYASEVSYNGALFVSKYGILQGTQQMNEIFYEWHYDGRGICTTYHFQEEEIERCIF